MALMPAGAVNPFSPVNPQAVIGTLKSTGSQDPDVLLAQKATLLAPYAHLKLLAKIGFAIGGLMTITIFMAWFGIPVLFFSWLLWRFQARQIGAVEEGYAQFTSSMSGLR